jgi:hypothetical protein
VFLRVIRDSGICMELEVEIFGAYPLLEVFITSPKFCLKAPRGLRVPDSSWRGLTRGQVRARAMDTNRTVRPSITNSLSA